MIPNNNEPPRHHIRAETAEMVRRELSKSLFPRDTERFIESLDIAYFRDVLSSYDAHERERTQALNDDAKKIDSAVQELGRLIGFLGRTDLGHEVATASGQTSAQTQLVSLLDAASEVQRAIENDRRKQNGRYVSGSVEFIAHVIVRWKHHMPNQPMRPHGATKRICEGLVLHEELPFSITTDNLRNGLDRARIFWKICWPDRRFE